MKLREHTLELKNEDALCYVFNDVEYGRFYEVAHAVDLWLEKTK